MPSITLRVQFSETQHVDQLFQLQRDFFPNDQMIHADQTGYVLDLDSPRAEYLIEMLALAPDCRGFEPFVEWDQRHKDQMPLEFGRRTQLSDESFEAMVR